MPRHGQRRGWRPPWKVSGLFRPSLERDKGRKLRTDLPPLRDDRPFGGRDRPAVLYEFTPDRKGEHPQRRLRDFHGILQTDAYAGFNSLYEGGRVVEAACWTHARRYFQDEWLATGSPIAREAIERIQPLFAIEAEIHGQKRPRPHGRTRHGTAEMHTDANSRGL